MINKLFIVFCLFAFAVNAQTKKPGNTGKTKTKPAAAVVDSTGTAPTVTVDPMVALEESLPLEVTLDPMTGKKVFHKDVKRSNDSLRFALRKSIRDKIRAEVASFWVRTKYPAKGKTGPTQLCMNIVSKDTNLVYCINDSIVLEPETSKVLYEKKAGDSTYMLIFIEAYSKSKNDNGLCNGGKETKLFFARWNTKTNSAKWKSKNVRSCLKGITLMGKDPFTGWDKTSPLLVKYHRADFFYEIKFDPAQAHLGLQTVKDEGKDMKKDEGKNE
jgi:hypothetical protein